MLKYIVLLLALALGNVVYLVTRIPPMQDVPLDRWWGPGEPKHVDTAVRRFQLSFDESMVEDLKYRLKHRRPPVAALAGTQSQYGFNSEFLEELVDYWLHKYDFKARSMKLNKQPHFKTNIQGLDIHFVHVKPKIPSGSKLRVLPIMLLHGWPSSSKEFEYMIPLLTTPRDGYDFVYEVISPDLPGYGFSEGTNKPGLNAMEIGIIMRNLMHRLGFERFYIQAGDWGSQAAVYLATILPEEVLGLHINLSYSERTISKLKILLGCLYPPLVVEEKYANRLYPMADLLSDILRETGYFHIQATKPDTVGVSLTDSPSGLAAYMLEKIAVVTNRDLLNETDGGLLKAFKMDDLLDWMTINWANNCATTSMRLYAESTLKATKFRDLVYIPTAVPTAVINFRHEVLYQPDWVLRDKFPNLVHSTTLDYGGHFAALENPDVLATDVWEATLQFILFNSKEK